MADHGQTFYLAWEQTTDLPEEPSETDPKKAASFRRPFTIRLLYAVSRLLAYPPLQLPP